MSDHTHTRLERGGEVIAYFAPNFETNPVVSNDIMVNPMPDDNPSLVFDHRRLTTEITVQGVFEDTHDRETGQQILPDPHVTDLQNVFGQEVVTARDQVNRIRHYIHEVGGPFELYEGTDEYTAFTRGEVDWENGIMPAVTITEFRPPTMGGHSRFEYTVKFTSGVSD